MTTTRHLLIPGPPNAKTCAGCSYVDPSGWCVFEDTHQGQLYAMGDVSAVYPRSQRCLAAERAAREQQALVEAVFKWLRASDVQTVSNGVANALSDVARIGSALMEKSR